LREDIHGILKEGQGRERKWKGREWCNEECKEGNKGMRREKMEEIGWGGRETKRVYNKMCERKKRKRMKS